MEITVVKSFRKKRPRTRRGTKKALKTKSLSKLKKELDRVFSLYIRAKYPKRCFTCKREDKTLQCGHFISRMYLATRWMESNCRPQCVGCNIWGRGQLLDFEENLKAELGSERVELMKELRKKILKLDREFYEDRISHFKEAIIKYEVKESS